MLVTVMKIGSGTDADPFRPDTTSKKWVVIEEIETEFVIQILD